LLLSFYISRDISRIYLTLSRDISRVNIHFHFGGIGMPLPDALKRFRKAFKITQKQAALSAGVSERNYQDYEYGKVVPSIAVMIVLADAYNVSLDYLVGRSDVPERR